MQIEYFEDIEPQQIYRSRGYTLTEKEIIDFAREWDPQPFHLDPEIARKSKLGSLCASGIHLIAICGKLMGEKKSKRAFVAGAGFEKVEFLTPARPEDVLVMEVETTMKRESKSDPRSGITKASTRLVNQQGEVVLSMESLQMIAKRPKP